MVPTETETTPQANSRQRWTEVALIILVCFVQGGDPTPAVNESHYLPKAKHYWQPEWCAGDAFLESADAHLVFYWTIGWLTTLFSLPTVAWMGRLLAWLAFAWSWQRLSTTILGARYASVLSATLFVWLTSNMNFAGEWVVGGVEGKCFAYAAVLCGLAELARGRWHRVWPWLGLGGAFHVLVGGWSAIVVAFVWLLEPREKRARLVPMLPSLVVAACLALPGLVPALQLSTAGNELANQEAAGIYVFERLPHHLAPLSEPTKYLKLRTTRFALPLFVFLLLWQVLQMQGSVDKNPSRAVALQRICIFAAASFLICVAGLLWEGCTVAYPRLSAQLLRYYWFRLADVGVPLGAVFLVGHWLEALYCRHSKLAAPALTLALCLAGWNLLGTSIDRWQLPVAPAEKKIPASLAWQEACRWAADHSSPADLFLVPRNSQSLSWHAARKSLVTWKDVPQDTNSLLNWYFTYQDVFLYKDEFGEWVPYSSLAEQGTTRIHYLASKYKVDYLITNEYPPLDFPPVFTNAWYTIYDVRNTHLQQQDEASDE